MGIHFRVYFYGEEKKLIINGSKMFGFEKLISLHSTELVEMGIHFKLLFLPEEILIKLNLHNCQALAPGPWPLFLKPQPSLKGMVAFPTGF